MERHGAMNVPTFIGVANQSSPERSGVVQLNMPIGTRLWPKWRNVNGVTRQHHFQMMGAAGSLRTFGNGGIVLRRQGP